MSAADGQHQPPGSRPGPAGPGRSVTPSGRHDPGSGTILHVPAHGGPALGDAPSAYHRPMVFDLVRTTYGPAALDALAAAVARAKGGEPLRPVTVVVPSNYAGVAARRALARRHGVIGVGFVTLYRLAELLAGPDAGRPGARSSPVVARPSGPALAEDPGCSGPPRPAVTVVPAARPTASCGPRRPPAPSPGPGDARAAVVASTAGHRAAADRCTTDRPDGPAAALSGGSAVVDVGPLVVRAVQRSRRGRELLRPWLGRAGHGDRRGHRAGRRTRGASPRPARPGRGTGRSARAGRPAARTVLRADGRGGRGRRGPHRPSPRRRGGRGRRRPGAHRHRPRATGAVRPAAVRASPRPGCPGTGSPRRRWRAAAARCSVCSTSTPRRPPAGRVRALASVLRPSPLWRQGGRPGPGVSGQRSGTMAGGAGCGPASPSRRRERRGGVAVRGRTGRSWLRLRRGPGRAAEPPRTDVAARPVGRPSAGAGPRRPARRTGARGRRRRAGRAGARPPGPPRRCGRRRRGRRCRSVRVPGCARRRAGRRPGHRRTAGRGDLRRPHPARGGDRCRAGHRPRPGRGRPPRRAGRRPLALGPHRRTLDGARHRGRAPRGPPPPALGRRRRRPADRRGQPSARRPAHREPAMPR